MLLVPVLYSYTNNISHQYLREGNSIITKNAELYLPSSIWLKSTNCHYKYFLTCMINVSRESLYPVRVHVSM